jgi:hypothetical protein
MYPVLMLPTERVWVKCPHHPESPEGGRCRLLAEASGIVRTSELYRVLGEVWTADT